MPGIYIHIPFCKQACHYCNFHFSTLLKYKSNFLAALNNEIKLRSNFFASHEEITTVYFGGGTPSLLKGNELIDIIEKLNKYYKIKPAAEITLEANPDDLTVEKVIELKKAGVNRLSIGVQSFFDEDLRMMNRTHNAYDALRSVCFAQDKGFHNISVDLIYGLPLLSNERWKENLDKTFELGVQHISCYNLTVEEKTALFKKTLKGEIKLLSENQNAEQFTMLIEEMNKNGFIQYEISNFCKDGFYSEHNSSYWKVDSYLGLGPSAHSFSPGMRSWNVSNNQQYIQSLQKDILNYEEELLSVEKEYNEYILTSLRTIWGCSLQQVSDKFGEKYLNYLLKEAEKYFKTGHITKQNNKLFLTHEGKLIADTIASDLFK